jgi:hypothetical protein
MSFAILDHIIVFFIEIVFIFEVKQIRNWVSDEVSHYMLDCEVIQTKWLLRIATYILNNWMFELVAINSVITGCWFTKFRDVNFRLLNKTFHLIKLHKRVESSEPPQEICYIYLGSSFFLFQKILMEVTSSLVWLSSYLGHKSVNFRSKCCWMCINVTWIWLPHQDFFQIINWLVKDWFQLIFLIIDCVLRISEYVVFKLQDLIHQPVWIDNTLF